MNRKQALIVDDSKTAQYLLKRMLQQYALHIDVASSAEEALAYLSYNHPAIIFLDQQMTGMTGFEALKTIKANPHTALIPVIMYSSQNDDLFVSQAIALGAQGFLSKSAMHPANLQQVLERLNIRKVESGVAPSAQSAPEVATSETGSLAEDLVARADEKDSVVQQQSAAELAELDQVRMQVGRLFELHVTDIKSQLNSNTQFLLKRLSTTIDKAANREASVAGNSLASIKSVVSAAIAAERRKGSAVNRVLMTVMIIVMSMSAFLLYQMQVDADMSSKRLLAALETKNMDRSMIAVASMAGMQPVKSAAATDGAHAIHPALLQAISWAQHADFQFDYGEPPLSGARLSNLHQLVQLLADGGYHGPLVVSINFGNFCLEQEDANTLRPARSDTKLASCKMQQDLNPRFAVSDLLTLQYQSLERTVPAIRDGRISLKVVSNGMSTPSVEYPVGATQTTAGEWNRVALRNNRIVVQIPN